MCVGSPAIDGVVPFQAPKAFSCGPLAEKMAAELAESRLAGLSLFPAGPPRATECEKRRHEAA
eukprot:CAMPEP_0117495908 /NCGR_PEP_ID=MMETSP0784-20121206/20378_1 /TAXON_ID=39447 /ORGANISM="" /LENGTH=62 /DNA_ID=CAMNT_0005290851 /DNA_START=12 /DNA_END=197 /DNA_ORIENTATION=-